MTTAPDDRESSGFGHGKVILLGEHAVVYGQPALAAGVPAGIRAVVRPGSGRIQGATWGLDVCTDDGSMVGKAVGRLLRRLGAPPLDLELQTEIPAGAGLGSSAAMAVAIARAVASQVNASEADLLAAVAEAESLFHTRASGIDAAAAWHGGVGLFHQDQGWTPIAIPRPFKLCVGQTGKARETRLQVEAVARLCERTPLARQLIETLGKVSEAGMQAIAKGDVDELGRLFDMAHGLLCGLRVSSAEVDAMIHGARASGAIGAKLTGAGGGGSVIALAPSHCQDVLTRWRADGFDGFETTVGHA